MKKFLLKLKELVEAIGFTAEFDGYYLVVNGAKFGAEARDSGGRTVVTFLGSNFVVDSKGKFNEPKALGLLLQELPKMLERLHVRDLSMKIGYDVSHTWTLTHGRFTKQTDQLSVGPIDNRVALVFESTDEEELRRAVEMLKGLKHTVEEGEATVPAVPGQEAQNDAGGTPQQQAG